MERIAVVGGGIAGLAVALAEKRSGREVLIIERDPEPPDIAPDQAFEHWARPGVPQFRHAHILLARLQTIVRDDHPELLAELQQAGLELSSLDEVLPESQIPTFQPLPEDRNLLHLWGRRATFEYVLRRHVARLAHVRFLHGARVVGLVTESSDTQLRVRGLELVLDADKRVVREADLVVDASGRRSKAPEWLAALGVKVEVFSRATERDYVCRHYRLRDAHEAPPRSGTGANFDYFGYATFYAEHGHFAITLSCPSDEREFSQAVRRPEGFEAVCRQLPGISGWIDASVPTTKVLGAGQFENRWTHYGARSGKQLSGFFAVGDSHVLTNPMYGRGCASAFLQAKLLSEVLVASADAQVRARDYEARSRTQMQMHFDFCVASDRMFQSRGKLSRGLAVPLADRVLKYLFEEVWTPAMHKSPLVAREMIKAMQMRELSSLRLRFGVLWHLIVAWFASRVQRGAFPRPDLGPERTQFLRSLPAGDDTPVPLIAEAVGAQAGAQGAKRRPSNVM
jgi:2-polyprenyl-6-methoxyphenol hydroxylase-like FAD-dependent oxidoreductase